MSSARISGQSVSRIPRNPGIVYQEPFMSSPAPEKVTHLLARAREGDRAAASEAYNRLNGELREIARRLFAGELPGSTLQPTVLVNEAWLKLHERDGRLN